MILSPQAYGKQFENEVHSFLSKIKSDLLFNETQIRKQDSTITAIDHLLIANNIIICFQDKWLKSTISNSEFNHFCKCVEKIAMYISAGANNMKIYGVYISNTDFSSIAERQLDDENNKIGSNIEYIKINNNDKNVIFKKLHYFLHSNHIYKYDEDNDCFML